MSPPIIDEPGAILVQDPALSLRSRAIADANRLRALARIALADGMPRADLRAGHARSAARSVLMNARRLSNLMVPDQNPVAESVCSTSAR